MIASDRVDFLNGYSVFFRQREIVSFVSPYSNDLWTQIEELCGPIRVCLRQ
jgi:hypothetical protein